MKTRVEAARSGSNHPSACLSASARIHWRTNPKLFANAFTVESYVTDRWTKQKENIVYFDNVVIAKEYIGPARASQE